MWGDEDIPPHLRCVTVVGPALTLPEMAIVSEPLRIPSFIPILGGLNDEELGFGGESIVYLHDRKTDRKDEIFSGIYGVLERRFAHYAAVDKILLAGNGVLMVRAHCNCEHCRLVWAFAQSNGLTKDDLWNGGAWFKKAMLMMLEIQPGETHNG